MSDLRTEHSIHTARRRDELQFALTNAQSDLDAAAARLKSTTDTLTHAISRIASLQTEMRKSHEKLDRARAELHEQEKLAESAPDMISKLEKEIEQETLAQKEFRDASQALVAHRATIDQLVETARGNYKDAQDELKEVIGCPISESAGSQDFLAGGGGASMMPSFVSNNSFSAVLPVSDPSHWQRDEDAPNCAVCQKPFSVMRWRHHCRVCAKSVCDSCSPDEVVLPPPGFVGSSNSPARGGGGGGGGGDNTFGSIVTNCVNPRALGDDDDDVYAATNLAAEMTSKPALPNPLRGISPEGSVSAPTMIATTTSSSSFDQQQQDNNIKKKYRVCKPCEQIYDRLLKARAEAVAADTMKTTNETQISTSMKNAAEALTSIKARRARIDQLQRAVQEGAASSEKVEQARLKVERVKADSESAAERFSELDAEIQRLSTESRELENKIAGELSVVRDAAREKFAASEVEAAVACIEAEYRSSHSPAFVRRNNIHRRDKNSNSATSVDDAGDAGGNNNDLLLDDDSITDDAVAAPARPTSKTFLVIANRVRRQPGGGCCEVRINFRDEGRVPFSAVRCCLEALLLDRNDVEAWMLLGEELELDTTNNSNNNNNNNNNKRGKKEATVHITLGLGEQEVEYDALTCYVRAVEILLSIACRDDGDDAFNNNVPPLSEAWTRTARVLMRRREQWKAVALLKLREVKQEDTSTEGISNRDGEAEGASCNGGGGGFRRQRFIDDHLKHCRAVIRTQHKQGEKEEPEQQILCDQQCLLNALEKNSNNSEAWTLLGTTIDEAQERQRLLENEQQQQRTEKNNTDQDDDQNQQPGHETSMRTVVVTVANKVYFSGRCCFKKALECNIKNSDAWYRLGTNLSQQQHLYHNGSSKSQINNVYVDAHQCFVESARNDAADGRKNPRAWNALGWIMKNTEAVIIDKMCYRKRHCYFEALRIDPTFSKAWNNLSLTMAHGHETVSVGGRTLSKLDCLLEALKHDENYSWGWYNAHGEIPLRPPAGVVLGAATAGAASGHAQHQQQQQNPSSSSAYSHKEMTANTNNSGAAAPMVMMIQVNGKSYTKTGALCEALRCDPDSSDAWNCLAWGLASEDTERRSVSGMQRVGTMDNDNKNAFVKTSSSSSSFSSLPPPPVAQAVVCGRKYDRLAAVREAIRCDFNNAGAWLNYGQALLTMSTMMAPAATTSAAAASQYHDNGKHQQQNQNQNPVTAKMCFCEALRIDPTSCRAWIDLAETLACPPASAEATMAAAQAAVAANISAGALAPVTSDTMPKLPAPAESSIYCTVNGMAYTKIQCLLEAVTLHPTSGEALTKLAYALPEHDYHHHGPVSDPSRASTLLHDEQNKAGYSSNSSSSVGSNHPNVRHHQKPHVLVHGKNLTKEELLREVQIVDPDYALTHGVGL